MDIDKTLYSILEVSENASDEVIRAAYLSLVKKFHPDGNPAFRNEATAITTELNYAYSILSDHAKRSSYDAKLREYRNLPNAATGNVTDSNKVMYSNKKIYFNKKWAVYFLFFLMLVGIGYSFRSGLGGDYQTANLKPSLTNEKTNYHVGPPDVVNAHETETECSLPDHGSVLKGKNDVTYRNNYVSGIHHDELYAPFEINPPKDKIFYLLKIKNIWNPDIEYQIFVHGGENPIEVNLLCGTYTLTYATGSTWYGTDDLFGNETRYYKADGFFRFYHDGDTACGQTITLYMVPNGNLSFEEVSSDDF